MTAARISSMSHKIKSHSLNIVLNGRSGKLYIPDKGTLQDSAWISNSLNSSCSSNLIGCASAQPDHIAGFRWMIKLQSCTRLMSLSAVKVAIVTKRHGLHCPWSRRVRAHRSKSGFMVTPQTESHQSYEDIMSHPDRPEMLRAPGPN